MKIVAVRSFLKNMALTKPYTISYSTFTDVAIAFLEIELANGMVGYGAGSPAEEVVGENSAQTYANLCTDFVQQFIGKDIRNFHQIIYESRQNFPHFPGTVAAIDIALHDAFGKFIDMPIASFYGQKIESLPTSVTIGIKNVSDTLLNASEYYKLGFKVLKVKLGLNIEEDIERILRLNELFQNKMTIRVDPNQGYTHIELEKFIHATKECHIELIEQPMPAGSESELLIVPESTRKTFVGDESLKDPRTAIKFAAYPQPFGIYNIKLMKCGGILCAMEIATIAKHAGIDLFWGCNDESILSITAALHVAYCYSNTKYIDLDGSFDLAEDIVTGGFTLVDGHMKINYQPGFGINIK